MATAKFHSMKEKTALILVKKNILELQAHCAYVPKEAIPEGIEPGESFEIPDGFQLVPMVGEDGNAYTTKNGDVLNMLAY